MNANMLEHCGNLDKVYYDDCYIEAVKTGLVLLRLFTFMHDIQRLVSPDSYRDYLAKAIFFAKVGYYRLFFFVIWFFENLQL